MTSDPLTTSEDRRSQMEALGVLAGSLAHEFGNMITVLNGNLERAVQSLDDRTRLRQALDDAQTAGTRAQALVDQLLRLGVSTQIERTPLDLVATAREAVRLLQPSLPIQVQVEVLTPDTPVVVLGSELGVQQIVINLLLNAARALDDVVTPRLLIVVETVDGAVGRLRIEDNGPGLPADLRSAQFATYSSAATDGSGAGLGLHIVRRLVDGMGATLNVRSDAEGTSFCVDFEVATGTPDRVGHAAPRRDLTGRILLVDDDRKLGSVIARALEHGGHRVIVCNDGAQALEVFAAAPDRVDLVLSDVVMPSMSGLSLVNAMRRIRPTLPVLLMSGRYDPSVPRQARAEGLPDVVVKPIATRDLLLKIRELLSR